MDMLFALLFVFMVLLAWDIAEYITGEYEFSKYVQKQHIKSDIFFIGLTLGCIILQYLL